jgi:HAD superfamily hydrolase (TIGR01509 family)
LEVLNERRRPLTDELQPMPGVLDVIEAARNRDWKLGLATGHQGTPLMDTLARLEILERFDAIVQSHEVPRPKPAPDIFLETARRIGVEPPECLVLEDSLAGYQAAKAANARGHLPLQRDEVLDLPRRHPLDPVTAAAQP